MALSTDQIQQIQQSFAYVAEDPDAAARLFYARLFEVAPQVQPMFKGDMSEQGRKLMQTLSVVVSGLTRLDDIIPAIQALGQRHVKYGVQREHYAIVGEALIWTLATALEDKFTEDVRAAWLGAYTLVADTATAGIYD